LWAIHRDRNVEGFEEEGGGVDEVVKRTTGSFMFMGRGRKGTRRARAGMPSRRTPYMADAGLEAGGVKTEYALAR
jgi:hypothetical protein